MSGIISLTERWLNERQGNDAGEHLLSRPNMFRPSDEFIPSREVLRRSVIPSDAIETMAAAVTAADREILNAQTRKEEAALGAFVRTAALTDRPKITTREGRQPPGLLGRLFNRGSQPGETTIIEEKAPFLNYIGPTTVLPHTEMVGSRVLAVGQATAGVDILGKGRTSLYASSRGGSFQTSLQNSGKGNFFDQNIQEGGAGYAEHISVSFSMGEITSGGHIEMGFR